MVQYLVTGTAHVTISSHNDCYTETGVQYLRKIQDGLVEYGNDNLAEHIDESDGLESQLISSITMEITADTEKLITHAKVVSSRILTSEEETSLIEYISGQYSDGWGEGFEQFKIDSFKEEESGTDDDGEPWEDDITYEVCCNFWFYDAPELTIKLVEEC